MLADIVVCVIIVVTKSQYSYTRARKVLHKLYEITEKHCVKTKEYINEDSSMIREGMYLRQAKSGGDGPMITGFRLARNRRRGANEGGCGGVRHPPNNLITIVKSVPNCVNLRIKVNYSFYCPCFTRCIPKN